MCQTWMCIETKKLMEIMVNYKLIKLCIEFLSHGHQETISLVSQHNNVSRHLLHHSTRNIKCERFLKWRHKFKVVIPISANVPEVVHQADEKCCWCEDKDKDEMRKSYKEAFNRPVKVRRGELVKDSGPLWDSLVLKQAFRRSANLEY